MAASRESKDKLLKLCAEMAACKNIFNLNLADRLDKWMIIEKIVETHDQCKDWAYRLRMIIEEMK